ncbi:MAG: ABC transporter permease, partial [Victivallales bacterium]|nr:ABC transporter permease [Victivallales bacterium]
MDDKTIKEKNETDDDWSLVIQPENSLFSIDFREIWRYRDLCAMLIKRDIVTIYKQTVLGPLWFFIQPIMTTVTYMVVFGGIAKIPTDGVPQPLFYLAGICMWQYFADCLNRTSSTFRANAGIFSKVYFPRLVVPISNVVSNLIKFVIQFALFVVVYLYIVFFAKSPVRPNMYALMLPGLVAMLAGLALGFGIVFSSFTTKYRDLSCLLSFFVHLWMYATPVIYPVSTISNPNIKLMMQINPLTGILEAFKYG